jgi:hypothetical protein
MATRATRAAFGIGAIAAVAMRFNNALRYPPDWGFDGRFIWEYILRLTARFELPPPDSAYITSDPPGFFGLAALVMRAAEALGIPWWGPRAIPVLGTLAGLAVVGLAVQLSRRNAPQDPERAAIAGWLLLFLPAHIHVSAMVNEEIWSALFTSAVVCGLAAHPVPGSSGAESTGWRRTIGVGVAAGFALLFKLSGALAVGSAGLTQLITGWRNRMWGPALARATAIGVLALVVGGWFFIRSKWLYGYFHPPTGLDVHSFMFEMPPGERDLLDFVRIPLATFSDPQLLNPDLLRSVWGSVYATVWFDGHRYFLPAQSEAVTRLGQLTTVLALLPTTAFAIGLLRGIRRCFQRPVGPDLPLVLICGATLAGLWLYAFQNPFFASLKGTYLLGMCVPFAYYASETLSDWMKRGARIRAAVIAALALLAAAVTLGCWFDGVFTKGELPGLDWRTGDQVGAPLKGADIP